MITRIEQLRSGRPVLLHRNDRITEGILHQSESGSWYVLHDDPGNDGYHPDHMPDSHVYAAKIASAEHFSPAVRLEYKTTEKRRLLYDRVRLIRCMEKTYDKAREKGDESAVREIVRMVREDYGQHFLSYSQETPDQVSFSQKPDYRYENKSRTRTTLGRYIRRKLGIGPDRLSDNGMAAITREVFGIIACGIDKIRVVSGPSIINAYQQEIGGHSCMTGDDASELMGMYALNPEKISLVIYDNAARALLWTCDDGARVLDRIYPNGCKYVNVLHNWAKMNGAVYRVDDGFPHGSIELSDGLTHQVTISHNGSMPYLDTFRYGARDGASKYVLSNSESFGDTIFDRTDGRMEDVCDCCGDPIRDGVHDVNGEMLCDSCWSDRYSTCENCGDTVDNDDSVLVDGSEIWCEHCAERHAIRCDHCNDMRSGNSYDVDGETWCESCFREEAGVCVECSEKFKSGDMHECNDGEMRCKGCASECKTCGDWVRNEDLQDNICDACCESKDTGTAEETVRPEETGTPVPAVESNTAG